MRRTNLLVLAVTASLLLTGCTGHSHFQAQPVPAGAGPDTLKDSPCACNERADVARHG